MNRQTILAVVALAAVAAGVAACDTKPAPQFIVSGTGNLTGQLFFDANNNGVFDPERGDSLLADQPIVVRERGGTTVIASSTTDAQGMFSFAGLPAGTHDLFLPQDSAALGGLVFCTNPVRPTVYIDQSAFVSAAARKGCVVPIATAEGKPVGTTVTFRGVVIAGPGTFNTRNVYVEDASGGVQVFGSPVQAVSLGDSVEITGTLTVFSGENEVTNPVITAFGSGTIPEPLTVTAKQVADAGASTTSALVGQLLTVKGVTVGSFATTGNPPTGANGTITDATGSAVIRLEGSTFTSIGVGAFAAGKCYDLVGVVGAFNGTAQFKPRGPADVVEVTCP